MQSEVETEEKSENENENEKEKKRKRTEERERERTEGKREMVVESGRGVCTCSRAECGGKELIMGCEEEQKPDGPEQSRNWRNGRNPGKHRTVWYGMVWSCHDSTQECTG